MNDIAWLVIDHTHNRAIRSTHLSGFNLGYSENSTPICRDKRLCHVVGGGGMHQLKVSGVREELAEGREQGQARNGGTNHSTSNN